MKGIDTVILYYFTGTGNALRAARWIEEVARSRGMKSEVHAIDRSFRPQGPLNDTVLVGFLYPTHGFNLAPYMLKFILKFPRSPKTPAFLLNTRAGFKFFTHVGPGLSGMAQILPMAILRLKGFRIRGGLPLDMPSNWVSLHPGYSDRWITHIVSRCEAVTKNFITRIIDGKRPFGKVMATLPLDLAVFPITLIYYLIGRFGLAKTFIYSSSCNDCRICLDNCPVGAIVLKHGKPYWRFRCESCMRCIGNCPQRAIQACHSFFAVYVAISNIPFTFLMTSKLSLPGFLSNKWVSFFVEAYLTLAITFLLYWCLQWLLKIKPINAIFTYTSLTRFWRRYRAPGISVKDYRVDMLAKGGDSGSNP